MLYRDRASGVAHNAKGLSGAFSVLPELISGQATGGSTTTLVDAAKKMVTDRYKGDTLVFTCGGVTHYLVVASNDDNTFTFAEIAYPTTATGTLSGGEEDVLIDLTAAVEGFVGGNVRVRVLQGTTVHPLTTSTVEAEATTITVYDGDPVATIVDVLNLLGDASLPFSVEYDGELTDSVVLGSGTFAGGLDYVPAEYAQVTLAFGEGFLIVYAMEAGAAMNDVTFAIEDGGTDPLSVAYDEVAGTIVVTAPSTGGVITSTIGDVAMLIYEELTPLSQFGASYAGAFETAVTATLATNLEGGVNGVDETAATAVIGDPGTQITLTAKTLGSGMNDYIVTVASAASEPPVAALHEEVDYRGYSSLTITLYDDANRITPAAASDIVSLLNTSDAVTAALADGDGPAYLVPKYIYLSGGYDGIHPGLEYSVVASLSSVNVTATGFSSEATLAALLANTSTTLYGATTATRPAANAVPAGTVFIAVTSPLGITMSNGSAWVVV